MPKYYCDYCDVFLTHDAPSVRRDHNTGWKHQAAIRTYFQTVCNQEKMARTVGEIIKEYEERREFVPIPVAVAEGQSMRAGLPMVAGGGPLPLLRPGMPIMQGMSGGMPGMGPISTIPLGVMPPMQIPAMVPNMLHGVPNIPNLPPNAILLMPPGFIPPPGMQMPPGFMPGTMLPGFAPPGFGLAMAPPGVPHQMPGGVPAPMPPRSNQT
jgi:U1 small nuclear ribonucleoprotein C